MTKHFAMSSKKKVVALCCQGFTRNVLPVLSDVDAAELVIFNDELQRQINLLVNTATALADMVRMRGITRKQFALEIAPKVNPKWLAGVAFGVMDSKDARMLTLKAVEKGGYENMAVKWRGE